MTINVYRAFFMCVYVWLCEGWIWCPLCSTSHILYVQKTIIIKSHEGNEQTLHGLKCNEYFLNLKRNIIASGPEGCLSHLDPSLQASSALKIYDSNANKNDILHTVVPDHNGEINIKVVQENRQY